jgi:hypothetical protein
MKQCGWLDVLKRIPAEEQDNLFFSIDSGTEISLQRILRFEEEFMLVRGRIGGTTDMGRVFVVPYSRIAFAMFNAEVLDEKLAEMFGEIILNGKEPAVLSASTPGDDGVPDSPPVKEETTAETKPAVATRSLRERLRARQAAAAGSGRSS